MNGEVASFSNGFKQVEAPVGGLNLTRTLHLAQDINSKVLEAHFHSRTLGEVARINLRRNIVLGSAFAHATHMQRAQQWELNITFLINEIEIHRVLVVAVKIAVATQV